jgi:hypothetical protein
MKLRIMCSSIVHTSYFPNSLSAILCTATGLHVYLRSEVLTTKNVKIFYDGIPRKSEKGSEVSYEFASSIFNMYVEKGVS